MRNWIALFESAEPTLELHHDEWHFNGFHVYAELLGDPKQCLGIMSFSSHESGQGNGERALRWLKEHVPAIHVYDPGQPGTDAFAFWKRMCDKGLIDSMEDEDNNIIYRNGEWAQLEESALSESAPRTLYHGTLKAYLPEIEKNGLVPTVGEFVSHFYDPSGYEGYDAETDALEPLVFAASKRDLQRCVNAIIFRLRDDRIDATYENVIKYGAIVAYRDTDEQFYKRPKDGERDYGDHPTQVEPGDFYSYEDIVPTYVVTGKRLRDLLRRNRIDGFVSPKPPIREAKYLDAWNCWQNPNGVALNNLLAKHGDLRGVCETLPAGKTSVYVWPALDEVHHRMRNKLGVEEHNCFSFYVCPTSAQFEDIPDDEERGDWVYGDPFAKVGNAAIYVEEDGQAACAANAAFQRMIRA